MTALAGLLARCAEIPVRIRNTGIYFLLLDGAIVYVGQSRDVDLRIGQHLAQREVPLVKQPRGFVPNGACKQFDRAVWFPVAEADLDAYEGALIRAIDPVLNHSTPIDRGRDIETLSALGLAPDDEARARFETRRRERFTKQIRSSDHFRRLKKRRNPLRDGRSLQRGRSRRLFASLVAIMQERAA